jgi:hypothetical protein
MFKGTTNHLNWHIMLHAVVALWPELVKSMSLLNHYSRLNLFLFNLFMTLNLLDKLSLPLSDENRKELNHIKSVLQKLNVLPSDNQMLIGGGKKRKKPGKKDEEKKAEAEEGAGAAGVEDNVEIELDIVSHNANDNFKGALKRVLCNITSVVAPNTLIFPDIICLQEINENILKKNDSPEFYIELENISLKAKITKDLLTPNEKFVLHFEKSGSPRNDKAMIYITSYDNYTGYIAEQTAGCKQIGNTYKNLCILVNNNRGFKINSPRYYAIKRTWSQQKIKKLAEEYELENDWCKMINDNPTIPNHLNKKEKLFQAYFSLKLPETLLLETVFNKGVTIENIKSIFNNIDNYLKSSNAKMQTISENGIVEEASLLRKAVCDFSFSGEDSAGAASAGEASMGAASAGAASAGAASAGMASAGAASSARTATTGATSAIALKPYVR